MAPPRIALLPLLLAAALLAVVATGCRWEEVPPPPSDVTPPARTFEGEPRAFRMGFSSVPPELTDEAYLGAIEFAARWGELLLIQRAPEWEAFLPGASVPVELRDQTVAEREAAASRGLSLVVVLDVFDPSARDRLQALPASHRGSGLDDGDLRRALVAEAVFVARNQHPAVLIIGSEVNATFERNPTAFAQFLTTYAEAYRAVKEIAPDILVAPSFQYEELLGVIPWQPPHAPRWDLLQSFGERLDLFAITTYPSFAYEVARKVPPLYYRQIRDYTDLPVAFISAGYSSDAVREGLNSSTAAEQRRFLQLRLLEDADWLGAPIVIWFAAHDLAFATEPPYDLLAAIGLRSSTGEPKEAWAVWEEASRRPYDPPAAEQARLARAREAEREPEADGAESETEDTGGTGGS